MGSWLKATRWVGVALLVLIAGCADPYKQTVELPNTEGYASFVEAMKKLPTAEKNLVNEYVARKQQEGVRPVGITLREAIDDQRRHEAEVASLPGKIIDGAVKVAQALGPKAPIVVAPAPTPTVTATSGANAAPTQIAPVVPTVIPAPVAPQAAPQPMTGLELSALLQEIDALPHPSNKAELIRRRAPSIYVTTRQAVALARTVDFPQTQVEILSALYPRVVDPQAFDEVYRIFTFEDDRAALRARVDAMKGR